MSHCNQDNSCTLHVINNSELNRISNKLVNENPGHFTNLLSIEFECSTDVPVIGYNIKDRKVMFNTDLFEDDGIAEAALGFISLLVKDADKYCTVPEDVDSRLWNIAVHFHIMAALEAIDNFELPRDSIELGIDKSGTLEEIFERVKVSNVGDIFADLTQTEKDEQDEESS